MSKTLKFMALVVLFGVLICIRMYEEVLFYDPYLSFFQNDYLYIDNPRRAVFKLTLFTTIRYVLNSSVSLAILYVVFRDYSIVKFSFVIFTAAFLVLISIYLYFVINPRKEDYYLFFNVRRFLIQPIILLLLLPAFYYHRIKS
ncbi:exosortase F system-associated membrane protein [Gaetbulibacter saemankumensis]|uniref:exosortase F system-associated membrane protein n=1 Tax=Gaetbulibacter saemankumensis TaxID=311208 RepID=UPI0003FDDA82|nr:exosortase F system-associated protein [Gaetbulibacter saemankumensis]